MELIKIVNAREVLESLSNRDDIGSHLSYWMTKFVVKTSSEYDFYLCEVRKLFDQYAIRNEDGTLFVPSEHVSAFNDASSKLNQTDVEDPGIRFNLSELSSELKLSMKQMYSLLDFIDEDR